MPRIVTANHLAAGDVVFLAENGWTSNVDLALVAEDEAGVAGLEVRAAEAEAANIVVGAYAIDVRREGSRIVPLHYREVMRTKGPTVRPDLGHQASLGA
jgi:hypothetical protein